VASPGKDLDLVARDLAVFWHPCSQMRDYRDLPPLEVVGARGCRLQLADGREIYDAISSWWCKSLGHGHPGVRRRIQQQLDRFEHVIAANTTNEPLVTLCERLLRMANGEPGPAWGPDAPGNSLSGGNQQKVSLARWLATHPKILILDEPTQGVDVGAKVEIHKIIRRLAASGLAVLMISSDLPEIVGMSDRIAVMRGGTVVSILPRATDAHTVMAAALGQKEGIGA